MKMSKIFCIPCLSLIKLDIYNFGKWSQMMNKVNNFILKSFYLENWIIWTRLIFFFCLLQKLHLHQKCMKKQQLIWRTYFKMKLWCNWEIIHSMTWRRFEQALMAYCTQFVTCWKLPFLTQFCFSSEPIVAIMKFSCIQKETNFGSTWSNWQVTFPYY